MSIQTGRVRWLLVLWLFLLSAVAFLDRVNISVAGSSIADAYSISNVQLGWIFSAFLVGYAVFQTPGGWLADRFGSRRVLTAGVVWWGIFTAMVAAVPSRLDHALVLFIALRFLLGAGEAIVYPASNQFVSRWIPTPERGIANGWIFAGVGAGSGLAPPLVTYVMLHWGWRRSFWLCAIVGIIAGIVWYAISRDRPEQHPLVSAAELAKIESGLTLTRQAEVDGFLPWRTILTSGQVWALTFSYLCYGYVAWIFFSWFYIYLVKVRGLELKASALYSTLPFLAMAVGCPLGGLIGDRLTELRGRRWGRCGLAAISMALASAFIAFGSGVVSTRLASMVLAAGAGALYLSQSSFWSVSADIGGASCGAVSGLMNMGAQIGGAVTASLTPAIASRYGWRASFLVAVILALCGGLLWLLVDPERKIMTLAMTRKQPREFYP
jgi:MFS transporter, ACS family, glucarate transporter